MAYLLEVERLAWSRQTQPAMKEDLLSILKFDTRRLSLSIANEQMLANKDRKKCIAQNLNR
jgi:hypothetical protein